MSEKKPIKPISGRDELGFVHSPLHGRRKGKKLTAYQAGLMHDLLPKLALAPNDAANVGSLFSAPKQHFWLEIGFGGGEHLAYQASRHPDIGFIGCEPFENGVAKLLTDIVDKNLKNVRVHNGDAGQIIDQLPDACVDMIYLLYPDPWPKTSQRKRRFVTDEMLKRMARILKPGAEFRFASDIDDYSAWTLARIQRSEDFSWNVQQSSDWNTPWPNWPGTRYERKAIREGRKPVYLTFVRRGV